MKLQIEITLGDDHVKTRHQLLALLEEQLATQINRKIVTNHYTQAIIADPRTQGKIHDESKNCVGTFRIIE